MVAGDDRGVVGRLGDAGRLGGSGRHLGGLDQVLLRRPELRRGHIKVVGRTFKYIGLRSERGNVIDHDSHIRDILGHRYSESDRGAAAVAGEGDRLRHGGDGARHSVRDIEPE